jgi:DNA-binding MarR family transcriptional regulator
MFKSGAKIVAMPDRAEPANRSGSSPGDDPRWLAPEQLREWRSLVALLVALPAALDTQLKQDAGLNLYEYHVLAALSEAPDRTLAMSDLAGSARGSLSRLSHAVARLEQSGWVERGACPGVGRRTQARLTAAGRRKLEQVAPGHVREARRLVVDALSPEQLRALGAAARTVVAVADPHIAAALRRDLADCIDRADRSAGADPPEGADGCVGR